jgi:hypothetical protein
MFSLGDFVLMGTLAGGTQQKLAVKWRGPRRIVAVESDWVFQVEDLLARAIQTVYASRLKFYHGPSLHVAESLLEHVAHQQSGCEVSSLKDLRRSSFRVRDEVLISWRGF